MENNKRKIHFIGIGGIGMSALAQYFLSAGNEVSGSEYVETPILDKLRQTKIKIETSVQSLKNLKNGKKYDLVIYNAAVPGNEQSKELAEAEMSGAKCQKYAQALGELTRGKYTIAVSGMHGKSTTTAMIGLMMEKAGLDPTVIVGTRLKEWGNSNFRAGKGQYLIIEADEYDRSFLNYWPKILVLLNIEEEHLDTYTGGLPDIMKTFEEYVSHLPEDGVLIFNEEDENVAKIAQNSKFKTQNYNSKLQTENLHLKVPGRYNLSNANAALAVARVLGIDENVAVAALNEFTGAWRRMEYKGEVNGAKIYDDYGHHPTEIKATLAGARELLADSQKLWVVFQPHQYQRTYNLFNDFVGAFGTADKVILLPIYSVAGRETDEIKKKVSSEKLAQAVNGQQATGEKVTYAETFDEAVGYLKNNLKPGDVCVIMGAGDIYKLTVKLLE